VPLRMMLQLRVRIMSISHYYQLPNLPITLPEDFGKWVFTNRPLFILITYRSEFHVHTLLSPCAEVEMSPPLIVAQALELGIHLIAITDHNASSNVEAVKKAAADTNLIVLPGMEIQTREDVHSLCIFDNLEQLEIFQELVDSTLPDLQNNSDYFGPQYVVDPSGTFIREEKRLLLTSSSLTLEDACKEVINLGGLFIPAHVDRKTNGLFANLGFIPPGLNPSAIEISKHITPQNAYQQFPQIGMFPLIQSGDVHRLDEFLAPNYIHVESPTVSEIKQALMNQAGRSLEIHPNL
jgi:PHP family Zn ribbon phosphoesterase